MHASHCLRRLVDDVWTVHEQARCPRAAMQGARAIVEHCRYQAHVQADLICALDVILDGT